MKKLLLALTLLCIVPALMPLPAQAVNYVSGNRPASDLAEANASFTPTAVTFQRNAASTQKQHTRRGGFFRRLLMRLLPEEGKSQIIAAVLAFLVGFLGVHRFYLGYPRVGFFQLIISILGAVLILVGLAVSFTTASVLFGGALAVGGLALLAASRIWALIDFIRIMTQDLKPNNGDYGQTF